MKRTWSMALLLVVVVSAVAIVATLGKGSGYTPAGLGQYRSTVDSVGALKLVVSVNASTLKSGGAISLAVDEYNPSTTPVNQSAAQLWKSRNVEVGFGCEFQNLPISLAVFRGYYTPDNISLAAPLQMVDLTAVGGCPAAWTVHSWVFQASSDSVGLIGCLGSTCVSSGNFDSTLQSFSVSGIYPSTGSGSHSPFPPGVYTVAAGDEWGALALIRFTVSFP